MILSSAYDLFYKHFDDTKKTDDGTVPQPKTYFTTEITPQSNSSIFNEIIQSNLSFHTNIKGFDNWLINILPVQIKSNKKKRGKYIFYFDDILYLKPFIPETNGKLPLFPYRARNENFSYYFHIYANFYQFDTLLNEKKIINSYIKIASVPAMLRSKVCHLNGYTKTMLKSVFEDSLDPFGYFIREGNEKISVFQENLYHDKILTIYKKDKVVNSSTATNVFKDQSEGNETGGASGTVAEEETVVNTNEEVDEADDDEDDDIDDDAAAVDVEENSDDDNNDEIRLQKQYVEGKGGGDSSSSSFSLPKSTTLNMTNVGGAGRNVVPFVNVETFVTLYSVTGTTFLKINSKESWPALQLNILSKGHKGAKPKKYPIFVILDIFLQLICPDNFMYDNEINFVEYEEWRKNYKTLYGENSFDYSYENYYSSSSKGGAATLLPLKRNNSNRNDKRQNIITVFYNIIDRFSNSINDSNIIKNYLKSSLIKYLSIESPYKYILKKITNDYMIIKKLASNLAENNIEIQTDFQKIVDFTENLFPTTYINKKPEIFVKMCFQHIACINGIRSFDDRDSWVNKRIKMTYENFSTIINCCFKYYIETKKNVGESNTINIIKKLKKQQQQQSSKKVSLLLLEDDEDDEEKQQSLSMEISNKSNLFELKIKKDEIKNKFDSAFGNEGFDDKPESVETLTRKTHLSVIQNATKVSPNTKKKTRQLSIRYVQPSQLGFICPYDSPTTGPAVGMTKSMGCLSCVSINRFLDGYLTEVLYPICEKYIGANFRKYSFKEKRIHAIIVNSSVEGWCNLYTFEKVLRKATKTDLRFFDVEIIASPEDKTLQIYTVGGNIVRPVLTVDEEKGDIISDFENNNLSLEDCIKTGVIEYITASEQAHATVAQTRENLKNVIIKNRKQHPNVYGVFNGRRLPLYCELDPVGVFSSQGALMPFQNTCKGVRVSYQTKMFSQSIGNYHDFHSSHFYTTYKRCESTRPVVETAYMKPIGFSRNPAGKMMMVAILALANNAEDGIIAYQDTIQNYRIQKYVTIKFTLENIEGNKDKNYLREYLTEPPTLIKGRPLLEEEAKKYCCIGKDGLPKIGSYLKEDYYIVCKKRETAEGTVDTSEKAKFGQNGIVERVWVTKNTIKGSKDYQLFIKIKLRAFIPLMIGDKLASRYSQKGIINNVRSSSNTLSNSPYNTAAIGGGGEEETTPPNNFEKAFLKTTPIVISGPFKGMIPDITINPHGQPSRMTPGMLTEMLATKASLFTGERIDATSYRIASLEKIEEWRKTLADNGCDPDGFEECEHTLTNGLKFRTRVFIAPCYYQNLKSVLIDEFQYRASGKKEITTGQPNTGRASGGGMKNGEQEKSAIVTWGATSLLLERFKISSDKHILEVCKKCGNQARINYKTNTIFCDICGNNNQEIGVVDTTTISVVINRILLALGIQPTVNKSSQFIEGELEY